MTVSTCCMCFSDLIIEGALLAHTSNESSADFVGKKNGECLKVRGEM